MYGTIWCFFWSTSFSSISTNFFFLPTFSTNFFFLTFVATNYLFLFFLGSPPQISNGASLKSMQKMVNWSLVEQGLDITKYLRHPYLGTKGDMGWGWGKATNRTGVNVFYTKPWGLTPLSSSLLDPLAASCLPR